MNLWNSTLKPSRKPMQRSALKNRPREKNGPGLAQRVAVSLGVDIKHVKGESSLLRSVTHQANVKALSCVVCGRRGPSDPAHANATKGAGIKACDSLLFPACRACHQEHDQGGNMPRFERWRREWEYVDATRALLIQKNKWPATVEARYQAAIQPIARVVHGDEVPA